MTLAGCFRHAPFAVSGGSRPAARGSARAISSRSVVQALCAGGFPPWRGCLVCLKFTCSAWLMTSGGGVGHLLERLSVTQEASG